MVNVVCFKWGSRYGAEYVNRLARMVGRNLRRPHRFVCFTDDPAGLEVAVESRPLPVTFPRADGPERYWNKLGVFASPLADLQGPTLCLDLDIVIVDSIDPLFDFEGRFCIIREFSRRATPIDGNSSVFRFVAGAHPEVLRDYLADPAAIQRKHYFDQHYISDKLQPPDFWPDAWCRSFKKHCLPAVPACYFRPARIPPGARIIIFHGHPNPPDAMRGCWVQGEIRYCHAAPWIAEHWQ